MDLTYDFLRTPEGRKWAAERRAAYEAARLKHRETYSVDYPALLVMLGRGKHDRPE